MFSNLNWTNVAILLLLALFIFGDKLPQIVGDALRLLRNLRRMATNATSDLSRELGTDIRVEDLHPRTFLRKHILSESDQEALLKPLKGVSDDVVAQAQGIERDFKQVGREAEQAADGVGEATGLRKNRLTRRGTRPGTAHSHRSGGSRPGAATTTAAASAAESSVAGSPAARSPAATTPATTPVSDTGGAPDVATEPAPPPRSGYDDLP